MLWLVKNKAISDDHTRDSMCNLMTRELFLSSQHTPFMIEVQIVCRPHGLTRFDGVWAFIPSGSYRKAMFKHASFYAIEGEAHSDNERQVYQVRV